MFTRGLMSLGDADWLTTRVDKWVAQCQGYSKLRNRRLSRGCQTMLDRPSPLWGRTASITPEQTVSNINISSLTLRDNQQDNQEPQTDKNFFQKQLEYDQDISNYIAYLNKPVINMNDHYIEIHQYHYEPSCLPGGQTAEEVPLRPPTRRKKHKIDMKKTEIVESKGINIITSPEYSEFLVKKETDLNRNIRVVSGRSSDEENRKPEEEDLDHDHHRPLTQKTPDKRVDTVIDHEGTVKVKRGQTFSTRSSSPPVDTQRPEPPLRKFLSFRTRTTRKNKSGRRKRVVVGEQGLAGPIWPAVLLTFDRSISPCPAEPADESNV